jgi:hypothetical protein
MYVTIGTDIQKTQAVSDLIGNYLAWFKPQNAIRTQFYLEIWEWWHGRTLEMTISIFPRPRNEIPSTILSRPVQQGPR